jgi:hypothetical protein
MSSSGQLTPTAGRPLSGRHAKPSQADDTDGRVHALFDFTQPETGPFPSDYFSVADNENSTGRRLNLPYPDCAVHVSDCPDLEVVNTVRSPDADLHSPKRTASGETAQARKWFE